MTFGSLFAGIGGFDLGFERAGMTCKWQVEIDPYCQRVLAKHWPNVRRHDDVRTFPPGDPGEWGVDVICGGFPCQDISNAGHKVGIGGERSGLWGELHRTVCTLRPRFIVVENVSALLIRGMDRVLGDLAESGYDAEWQCLPAACFGAPHIRDRIFLLGRDADRIHDNQEQTWNAKDANAAGARRRAALHANANGAGLSLRQGKDSARERPNEWTELGGRSWWNTEPNLGRVANGVPNRVDRLRGLGNAVVPQVAEYIGRRLMEAAKGNT